MNIPSILSPNIIDSFNSPPRSNECLKKSIEPLYIQEGPHPFSPDFCEVEQIRKECYQAGICNKYGKISEKYRDFSSLYSLVDPSIYSEMKERILASLGLDREILTVNLAVGCLSRPINVTISMKELFSHVLKLYEKGEKKSSFQIEEIFWIGSEIPKIIGKDFFEAIFFNKFKKNIHLNTIKKWFSLEHIAKQFNHEGKDLDYRIIISSDHLEDAAELSNALLNYVGEKIPDQAALIISNFHSQILKENQTPKVSYLFYNNSIRNRKIVDESKTRYAIIAFNCRGKPIDVSCVCSNEEGQILENLNLSSRYSWAISLMQLLSEENLLPEKFPIVSDFQMQAILDLLFDSSTPATFNQYAWKDFLRKNTCMHDPNDEKNMVVNVLDCLQKKDFQLNRRHSSKINLFQVDSRGILLYLLLENDFSKIEKDAINIQMEPYYLAGFLFRACQSLLEYSNFSDDEFAKMWEWVDCHYWKGKPQLLPSIYTSIKEALVDEKIPFSVLSAWIGILTYLWDPFSAKIHCNEPIIHLKKPFEAIIRIRPLADCEKLDKYFSNHPFCQSFQKINAAIANSHQARVNDFPLTNYVSSLGIDIKSLKEFSERWIKNNSSLNLIGLQLYLPLFSLLPDFQLFIFIIRNLPTLMSSLAHLQQKEAIIEALNKIAKEKNPYYQPFMHHFYRYSFKSSTLSSWVDLFIEMKTPESIYFAYTIFKESRNRAREKKIEDVICWKLFKALLSSHFYLAASLFQSFLRHYPLKNPQEITDQLIDFLSHYENQPLGLKIQMTLEVTKNIIPYIEKKENLVFRSSKQKERFSTTLSVLIDDLFSFSDDDIGESLLMMVSRLGYFTHAHCQSKWTTRIIQLIEVGRIKYGAILYAYTIKERWTKQEEFAGIHLPIGITLGEALLQGNECLLSLELFKFISVNAVTEDKSKTIFQILFNYLLNRSPDLFDQNEEEVLKAIIRMVTDQNRFKVGKQLTRYFLKTVQFFNNQSCNSKCGILTFQKFESVILYPKLTSIMDEWPNEWKRILLGYLKIKERVSSNDYCEHWKLFEKTVRLFKKDKDFRLQLYERLAALLNHDSPPPKVVLWIKQAGEIIVKQLYENKRIGAVKIVLHSIITHHFWNPSYNNFIWGVCKEELTCNTFNEKTLDLLNSVEAKTLIKTISLDDAYFLLLLIDQSVKYPLNQSHQLFQWPAQLLEIHLKNNAYFNEFKFNQCLLSFSEMLIKKSQYIEAAHILFKLYSKNDEQKHRIDTLKWSAFEWLFSKESFTEILSLMSSTNNFLKEMPSTISQKILVNFINSSCANVSQLIMVAQLVEKAELAEFSLWDQLWKKLDSGEFNETKHKIISKCWNYRRAYVNDFISNSEVDYCLHLFSCLKKISHPDLVLFFDQLDVLWALHKNSDKIVEMFTLIFLGGIKQFSSHQFDPILFKKILNAKNCYIEKFRQNNKKKGKQIAEDWNNKIEDALINQISSFNNVYAIQSCCCILQSKLSSLGSDRIPEIKLLDWVRQEIQQFFELEYEVENETYKEIKETILNFFEWFEQHEKIHISYLIELANLVFSRYSYQNSLFLKKISLPIIKKSTAHEFNEFKKNIFKTASSINSKSEFESIDPLFEIIISLKNRNGKFSQHEKNIEAQLSFFIFEHFFPAQNESIKQFSEINHLIQCFVKYAPYFANNPEFLQQSLNRITSLVNIFDKKKDFERNLEYLLDSILFISFQFEVPLNTKDYYDLLVFQTILQTGIEQTLLIRYFKKYGEFHLKLFEKDPSKVLRTIRSLETITYFFPPENFKINKNIDPINHPNFLEIHYNYLRELIKKASLIMPLKQFATEFACINFWIYPMDSNCFQLTELQQYKLFNLLTSFDPPSIICTKRAMFILNILFTNSLNKCSENTHYKLPFELQFNFNKTLEIIDKHENTIDKNGKVLLFMELFRRSSCPVTKDSIKFAWIRSKLCSIFYPYAMKYISSLSNDPKIGHLRTSFLQIILLIIRTESLITKNVSELSTLFRKTEVLLPIIRTNVIEEDLQLCKWLKKNASSPEIVILSLIRYLTEPFQSKDGKPYFNDSPLNQMRRNLLFQWFDLICEKRPHDKNERKCSILIHSFLSIFQDCKNDHIPHQYLYWFMAMDDFASSVKVKLINIIEDYGSPEEKLAFKSLFYCINLTNKSENLEIIISLLNFDEKLPVSKKYLQSIKIMFLSFIQFGKEVDPKEKRNHIVTTNPPELQRAFDALLFKLMIWLDSTPKALLLPVQYFLIGFTIKAFESQWLLEDSTASVKYINWLKKFLDKEEIFEPSLNLIFLLYEIDALGIDQDTFVEKLKSLVKPLCKYVIVTKELHNSWRFVHLFTYFFTNGLTSTFLEVWLNQFIGYEISEVDKKLFSNHMKELIGYIKREKGITVKVPSFKKSALKIDPYEGNYIVPNSFSTEKILEEFKLTSLED